MWSTLQEVRDSVSWISLPLWKVNGMDMFDKGGSQQQNLLVEEKTGSKILQQNAVQAQLTQLGAQLQATLTDGFAETRTEYGFLPQRILTLEYMSLKLSSFTGSTTSMQNIKWQGHFDGYTIDPVAKRW